MAADLIAHLRDRWRTLPGKAILVAYRRRAAAEYADRLNRELGDEAVDAVMGAQNIAMEIVRRLTRIDDPALGVHWTERAIPAGGGELDSLADRVFQQARMLYERWPEVTGEWLI